MSLTFEHDIDLPVVQREDGLRIPEGSMFPVITDTNIGLDLQLVSVSDVIEQPLGFMDRSDKAAESWERRVAVASLLGKPVAEASVEEVVSDFNETDTVGPLYIAVRGLSGASSNAWRAYQLDGLAAVNGTVEAVVVGTNNQRAVVPANKDAEVYVPIRRESIA